MGGCKVLVQAQERISVLQNNNLKQLATREKELVTIDAGCQVAEAK